MISPELYAQIRQLFFAEHWRFNRDERGAGEAVHGGVPAWCDAQTVLGGHTERSVQGPAVPERHALGERLERPRMARGLRQAGFEDRDWAVLYHQAGEVRAGSLFHIKRDTTRPDDEVGHSHTTAAPSSSS